jgi:hypothetical protein
LEIRLDDNSKLTFEWARLGLLSVQLSRPGFTRDGHGWIVRASALLDGPDLENFLDGLAPSAELDRPPQPPRAA